ncbi:MAG: GAF and ANTAR domain-containing protein, partial [Acidimicrobiales bacterium]
RRTLEILPVSGASVILMGGGQNQGLAAAFGASALTCLDLEFTLGEGPGADVCATGETVLVDDLQSDDGRWPQFSAAAVGLGVRSILALPLKIASTRLGALSLYGREIGTVPADLLPDALLVADLITHLVLLRQSEVASESVAWALEASDYRAVVHQATGMIAAQLDCRVDEALVRLRASAFAAEVPIEETAEAVVRGDLRFDDP